MKVVVLGIGSPFGDDRVGWAVIERMKEEGVAIRFPDTRFDTADRPGSLLLAALEGADAAILIDAVDGGLAPGEIVHLVDEAIEARAESLVSSHGLGLASALQLGRALGKLPPKLFFYGVQLAVDPLPETADVPLSAEVTNTLGRLIPRIEDTLRGLGGGG